MKRLVSALVALPLLLAFALPVAAADETPACPPAELIDGVYVIPEGAPEGCMSRAVRRSLLSRCRLISRQVTVHSISP